MRRNFSWNLFFSSSLVLKILKDAHNAGKKFRVVVVDSRPKFEGEVFSQQWLELFWELTKTHCSIYAEWTFTCTCNSLKRDEKPESQTLRWETSAYYWALPDCTCVIKSQHLFTLPLVSLLLGRECLRRLVKEGIRCSYVLISAISYVIKEVSIFWK